MKEYSDEYDIAIVEGSIMRPMDEKRLRTIRRLADTLVAFGACAAIGGINKIRNQWSPEKVKKRYTGNQIFLTMSTLMLIKPKQ